jgi:hypothetical protein
MMERDPVADAGCLGRPGPLAEQIALRTHAGRIPRLEPRIPQIEIVVVYALHDQETRAGGLVERSQPGRIELAGIPVAQHLLVADARWMPLVLEVIGVGGRAGDIHLARVPIPAHSRCLRTEMYPDAEFGVAQPGRRAGVIFLDRFPAWFEGAGRDGQIELHFRRGIRVGHRHAVLRQRRRQCRHRWQLQRQGGMDIDGGGEHAGEDEPGGECLVVLQSHGCAC